MSGCISLSQINHSIINGQVLDQDGNPLSGVSITYSQHELRPYSPIPFGPMYKVKSSGERITDSNGNYTFKRKYEHLEYTEIQKKGYKSESLKPTYVRQDRNDEDNPTLWLHKIIDNEKNNIIKLTSESVKLDDFEIIYFSIRQNKFTSHLADDSDIEISLYKRIGDVSYPMVIRAPGGGMYCSRNDMPYAPLNGYEPGIIVNTIFGWNGDWIPFFYHSKNKKIYARLWLKLDARSKTISIEYSYNKSGNRYIDFDFHKINDSARLWTFAHIERTVPLQREWWVYADKRRLTLITSEKRFHEIWEEFKDTDIEPYKDTGRGYWNGGLTRINRFLANDPLTPKDILSEIAETDDVSVIRLLLKNPSLTDQDFKKLIKLIHKDDVPKYISARNNNKKDWDDFLYEFIAEGNRRVNN